MWLRPLILFKHFLKQKFYRDVRLHWAQTSIASSQQVTMSVLSLFLLLCIYYSMFVIIVMRENPSLSNILVNRSLLVFLMTAHTRLNTWHFTFNILVILKECAHLRMSLYWLWIKSRASYVSHEKLKIGNYTELVSPLIQTITHIKKHKEHKVGD